MPCDGNWLRPDERLQSRAASGIDTQAAAMVSHAARLSPTFDHN
jgi:hypothetical protein